MINNKKGAIAISQIMILIIGIFAVGFLVGSIPSVSSLYEPVALGKFVPITTAPTASVFGGTVAPTTAPTASFGIGSVLSSAGYAVAISYGIKYVLNAFGVDGKLSGAIGNSIGAGFFVSSIAVKSHLITQLSGGKVLLGVGATPLLLAGGVALVVFALTYHRESQDLVTFDCQPWAPASKGENCEDCNKQGDLSCSEYQCRSLGQSCELINKGTLEESCVWVNRNDINPPIITP